MKKNKKIKDSVAEKIMKIITSEPKLSEVIKQELKDGFGYNFSLDDIRVNLLYLLRRGRVKRKKEDKKYKYHI
jgi:Fe-S oxidoreductase